MVSNIPTAFNTSVWLTNAVIDISSGHQIMFNSPENQREYFTSPSRSLRIDANAYIKNRSGSIKLELDMASIVGKYNYLVFVNQEHENKFIYCNIIDYQYVNERIVILHYSVDNFQTYQFDINLDFKSDIARRHYRKDERTEIRNLPYEDLDRGRNSVLATDTVHHFNDKEAHYIITLNTPIKKIDGINTPLSNQYVDNVYVDENGTLIKQKHTALAIESCIVFIVNYNALIDLVNNVFNTKEHVNKLIKISYIPFSLDLMNYQFENIYKEITGQDDLKGTRKMYRPSPSVFTQEYDYNIFKFAKHLIRNSIKGDYSAINSNVGDIDQGSLTAQEQYFLRAPFTSLQISDVTGNITEYDYKMITDEYDDKLKLRVFGTLGIIPNIAYNVLERDKFKFNIALSQYNRDNTGNKNTITSDLNTKYITPIESFSIINDYSSAFMQANQNALGQQKKNINTSFEMTVNNSNAEAQRSLSSAQLAFNNGNLQRETEMSNFAIKQSNEQANNTLGLVGQGANLALNTLGAGLGAGGIGGAITTAIGGGINMAVGQKQFDNSMQASSSMFNNSMSSSIQIANNNLNHQQSMINDMRAQNIRNAHIQSKMQLDTMNARMLDVQNAPNSLATMTSGTVHNVLWNRYFLNIRTFVTHPYAISRLSNYLATYGFLSNRRENLKNTIGKFSTGLYIQTVNADIRGLIPQPALQDIKQQFDNGLTIWKKPEYYKNIDLLKEI